MNWFGHAILAFSLTSLLIVSLFLTGIIETTKYNMLLGGAFIVIATFFSLVPDLDQKDSKMSQLIRFAMLILAVLGAIFLFENWIDHIIAFFALYIIGRILNWLMRPKLRGFVHSIAFGLLVAGAITGLFWIWKDAGYEKEAFVLFSAIFAGYYSHLVCDGKFLKVL